MAESSQCQTDFRGGEWSPTAQGKLHDPALKTALNVCSNAHPMEDGSWIRRSGFRHLGYSFRGNQSRSLRMGVTGFQMEISFDGSNGHGRFLASGQLCTNITKNISAISNATPAVVQTSTAHGMTTGDDVVFNFNQTNAVANSTVYGTVLQNVVCTITVVDSTHFSIVDAVSGANIVGTGVSLDTGSTSTVSRVVKIALPFTSWAQCNGAHLTSLTASSWLLTTNSSPTEPQVITGATFVTNSYPFVNGTFSIAAWAPQDGPYLGVQDGGTASASGASGSITFSISGSLPNQGNGWTSNDVGRAIRILSEPTAWSSATAYSAGAVVTVGTWPNSVYYAALGANTNVAPGSNYAVWAPFTGGAQWTWGLITAVGSTSSVTMTIEGPNITYSTNVTYWLQDAYNTYYGWPNYAAVHDGRLWLIGARDLDSDRIDGSASFTLSNTLSYAPTDQNGIVGDANAISYALFDPEGNDPAWMVSDDIGLVIGKKTTEWLLFSNATPDPLTPTNVAVRPKSKFGSFSLDPPIRCNLAWAFANISASRVIEYFSDTFSASNFTGHVLTDNAHQLIGSVNALSGRLAYLVTPTTMLWAGTAAEGLVGCLYRRSTKYATQPPDFTGWHRHSLGSTWGITDIAGGANWQITASGAVPALWITSNDGTFYHNEMLMEDFDADRASAIDGFFLDEALTPSNYLDGGVAVAAAYANDLSPNTTHSITFHGLRHLIGKTVSVFIAGLDCGTYTVATDGTNGKVTVPYGSDPDGLLTASYLNGKSNTGGVFHGTDTTILVNISGTTTAVTVPVVIGIKYLSEGQKVRPDPDPDAKTKKGDAVGDFRRIHRCAFQVNQSGPFNIGTSSALTFPTIYKQPDGVLYAASAQFTGVYWDAVEDLYGPDGMLYWNTNSCFPLAIAAANSFLNTEEL